MKETISGIVRRKFLAALDEYDMLDSVTGVLVGFSGGADSSALLRLMADECSRRGIFLKAVHVHHGIRAGEADRDALFCEKVCLSLGIAFELVRADIPAMAKESGRGLEETARDFRYSEFLRILDSDDRLNACATAHNSDDNAETLLFNLIRGAGIGGLSAIPPVRGLGKYRVLRPLIAVTKAEIIDFCRENSIDFIHDSTNDDTAYTRNYIRHELIPAIERLNPAFSEAALRLSGNARSDEDCLDSLAKELTGKSRTAKALAEAHHSIASRAIVRMYSEISDAAIETVHIESVLKLCRAGRGEISLPDRVYARIDGGELIFTRAKKELPDGFCYRLKPGVNRFEKPDFAIYLSVNGKNAGVSEKDNETLKKIYNLSIHTELNSDTINHMLFVRSKRDGDSYLCGGMTRKLKKLFNDRKINESARRTLPILCDENGIIWVPGFHPADRARPCGGAISVYYYFNEVLT